MPTPLAWKRLWIATALIVIAVAAAALTWQRWRAPRRSVYIVGVAEKGR